MEYVLNELYRVDHDEAYVGFAEKIAQAIRRKQHLADGAPAPDWAGMFYEGQTTLAATRVEAYDSDGTLRLASRARPDGVGDRCGCAEVAAVARCWGSSSTRITRIG